jgi:hypothetical protein
MDYPFSHFLRHIAAWDEVRLLTDVLPKPEEQPGGDIPIHVGRDASTQATHLRIMHMLSSDGCTPEERNYRGPRFFFMVRFIGLHIEAFQRAGLVLIHDGVQAPIPHALYRAIHETFRGEPLRSADSEPVSPIIDRAKTYTGKWTYE